MVKHNRLYSHAQTIQDTISLSHMEAVTKAYKKHLRDEKGNIDLKLLDDTKKQSDVVGTMKDFYVSRARQELKVGEDLNQFEQDMLLRATGRATYAELKNLYATHGRRMTHQQYVEASEEMMKRLRQDLYASASAHLEEKHIPQIIKHIGLEGRIDSSKIALNEAQRLLQVFHDEGTISDSVLRQVVPHYKLIEKKMKKAA